MGKQQDGGTDVAETRRRLPKPVRIGGFVLLGVVGLVVVANIVTAVATAVTQGDQPLANAV